MRNIRTAGSSMHREGARDRRAEGLLRGGEGALHLPDGDAVKIVPQVRKRIVEQQQ